MTYERLLCFVKNRMRMPHVYQPVMLMALLRGGSWSSTREIARSILLHDESQVEYYQDTVGLFQRTSEWPPHGPSWPSEARLMAGFSARSHALDE